MSCIKRVLPLPLQKKKQLKKSERVRQIRGLFNSDISSRLSSVHFQKFNKCYPRAQSEEITFGFLRRCWLAKVKAHHCFNSACRCCLCQTKQWISSSGGSDDLKQSNCAGVSCVHPCLHRELFHNHKQTKTNQHHESWPQSRRFRHFIKTQWPEKGEKSVQSGLTTGKQVQF